MTKSEFVGLADMLDTIWQRPGPFGEKEERGYFMVLEPFEFKSVEARLLEVAREPGRVFRPAASELVPSGAAVATSRERLVAEFRACCRIYGREIAVAFFDPNGTADWLPSKAPGHDAEEWGKARKQLLDLGVLEGRRRARSAHA